MKFYTDITQSRTGFLVRGYEDGIRFSEDVPYCPKLYLPDSKGSGDGFFALDGTPLTEMKFSDGKELKQFIDQYKDIPSFRIFGNEKILYQFIADHFPDYPLQWDYSLIRIGVFDIECEIENGFPDIQNPEERINVITLFDYKADIYYVFALDGDWQLPEESDSVHLLRFDSEEDLLVAFVEQWQKLDLDIICGWNVKFFDIPYTVNRIEKVLGERWTKKLSPWNRIHKRDTVAMGRSQDYFDLVGMVVLDYMELYRLFSYKKQESYKLDYIASIELDEKKLDYSEYESIKDFYKKDFGKFVSYNIHDVRLVKKLNDKLKMIELILTMAYDAKVNILDIFSQVRTWDAIIFNHLLQKKTIIPLMKSSTKEEQYAGAYVKDPQVGMHNWIVSFDLNSLYPHIILEFNMSPETLVECPPEELQDIYSKNLVQDLLNRPLDTSALKKYNLALTSNGQFFRKDQRGFLPELMDRLYQERVKFKRRAIEAKKKLELVKEEIKRRGLK